LAHREGNLPLGVWVGRCRGRYRKDELTAEQIRALQALPGWSWDPLEEHFTERVQSLRAFVHREGNALIPSAHLENGVGLGRWAEHLRSLYRAGRLPERRIRILERFPRWTWEPGSDLFDQCLAALGTFARREGHTRVPHGHVEEGVRLDHWVQNRRQDRRKKRLSRDRIRALESIPNWTWSVREAAFDEGYAHLLRFVQREGHARVPYGHIEGRFPLGAWVHKQRTLQPSMGAARARRLAKLPGWVWRVHEARFENGLRLLRAFVDREGHARVPAKYLERGFPLGSWVSHCRRRRRAMREDRIAALEALPGWAWRLRPARRPKTTKGGTRSTKRSHR
jgi:hypothetical protein